MKISKTKYTVEFTEKEKEAIVTICNIANNLYVDDLCADVKCENCPFHNGFCLSGGTNNDKVNIVKHRIEKFLNGEN